MTDLIEVLRAALAPAFAVDRELGPGGMSRVFVAEERELHRQVVIKVLPPELAGELSVERFRREMELAASLQHPHIVPVLQAGHVGELLYYTMPFVAGESLRTRLDRGPLPIAEAALLLRDVADAIAYAHRHGVVHRDIKPDNVLVSDHHAVVTDFGVAKAVSEATRRATLTSAGIAIGTPAYMAPEQAAADPRTDHRADIYALGALAYEMLTGRAPFVGTSPQMIFAAQLTGDPEPCRKHRPDVPASLESLVMRCLARQPDKRWQSADDLLPALAAVATPTGGTAASRALPSLARLPWRHLAIAVALLVVAAGIGLWWRAKAARLGRLVATVQPLAQAGRFDEVARQLQIGAVDISDSRLEAVAQIAAGTLAIGSEPPGASVTATRVSPLPDLATHPAVALGRTPIEGWKLVAGEYLLRVAASRFQQLAFTVTVDVAKETRADRTLVPDDSARRDMVYVTAGTTPAVATPEPVGAFLAERHEVTNARYLGFVAGGGYRDPTLWPDSLIIQGRRTPRDAALAHFTDRTGLPGPRSWSGGTYPPGEAEHPVVGVSWYEAAAFARWQRKELPSLAQWYRAAVGNDGRVFPWGNDVANAELRANFGLAGTRPVGTYPLGVSAFGCLDMAGNVREWLADSASGSRRLAVGGGWQDPSYMFEPSHVEGFDPSFASPVIGIRLVAYPLKTATGGRQ